MKKYIKATVAPYQTLWDWIRDYQGDPDSELNIIDVRGYPDSPNEHTVLCNNETYYAFTTNLGGKRHQEERLKEIEWVGKYYDVMKVKYDPDLDRYYIEVEHND